VCGWGYFLIQGVRDPLGGINSLWPLFGIANQMLAAIALCLATTIILKMGLQGGTGFQPVQSAGENANQVRTGRMPVPRSPALAIITLVPLIWLVAVTFTAGVEKIWHPDLRIGFLAQAKALQDRIASPGTTAQSADPKWLVQKAADNVVWTAQRNNNLIDAAVAGIFLVLVAAIVCLSVREWILLLSKRKPAVLREAKPVWLPDYAVTEGGRNFGGVAGTAALALALAKELSGEAQLERAHQQAGSYECAKLEHGKGAAKLDAHLYTAVTEQRFKGVRRCC
jgi:carbon starvation protein